MKAGNPLRGLCLWLAPVLAAGLCLFVLSAHAQPSDPYKDEWSGILEDGQASTPTGEGPPGSAPEEDLAQPPEGEDLTQPIGPQGTESGAAAPGRRDGDPLGEDESRRMDGAAARRALLFRDGLDEREFHYPRGLEPAPPVERIDPQVYDARYRGRNAQVLGEAVSGLAVDGSVSAGMRFDTNPRLVGSNAPDELKSDTWGWFVEPQVALTRRTARTLIQGVVRLPYNEFNSFDGDANDELSSFNQYAGLQLDMVGRTNAFNVFTNVSNSTTRTAIVEDTGQDLSGDRALTYGGGGSFKHAPTPDSVIQLSAAARRQELESFELQDYTYYQAALDYRMLLTSSDAAGLGAIYNQFLPDEPEFGGFFVDPETGEILPPVDNPDVRIITALVNWSRQVSANMSFRLEGGAQIITSENGALSDIETGTTIGPFIEASLYWARTNRDSFFFSFGHSAEPTAAGEVRINNRLEIVYQRELTRTIALGVPLLFIFQTDSFEDDFEDRTFIQFAPNLVWTFSPSWALSAEYRFRFNDEDDLPSATSNTGFLGVTWYGRLLN